MAVLLVLGFAILCEKDQWLTKQTLHAGYLLIGYQLITWAISAVFGNLNKLLDLTDSNYSVISGLTGTWAFLNWAVGVWFFVYCLLALIQLISGKEIVLPGITGLVCKTMGIVPVPVYPTQAPPTPQAPMPPHAQTQAHAPVPPVPQPVESWVCPVCGQQCNSAFCSQCGTKKA